MRNKATLLTMLLALCVQLGYAQSRTISGVVKDAASGETLPGVAVLEKGTSNGTSTNFDGEFELTLSTESPVLVISAMGRESREVSVGSEEFISIKLREESQNLNEVVVTALGISREKRSLGYATQEVDGEATVQAKDANFMNSLQGKVAGMQVKSSGTMGGSSNVIIRGFKSLSGNNQALFVVDGIPISNDINNSSDQRTGRGGFDYGNNSMDINPNDIKSINVLKGAAATALYGSRAANGAVIITTKDGSGREGKKGIGVSINSNASLQMIDESTMPTYQQEYGPGYGDYYNQVVAPNGDTTFRMELFDVDGDGNDDVVTPMGEDASFGAPFALFDEVYTWESIYEELGTYQQKQPFEAGANTPVEFYRTALNLSNNVALTGANEQGNFRLSFTHLDQDGVLPNSNLERINTSFNGGWSFTDRLKARTSVQFINTEALGRFGTGYDNRNPNQSFRQWWNVGADVKRLEEAYDQTGLNLSWNPFGYGRARPTRPHYFDNPYFVRYENFQNDERDRIIGNFILDYKLTDWLTAVGRVNLDNYSSIQEERIAVGSVDVPLYRRRNDRFTETNTQFRLDMNKYFGDDNEFNFNANLGVNIRNTESSRIIAQTNGGLVVPGLYALSNSLNPIQTNVDGVPTERNTIERVYGYFTRASIGYDNWLYVDLTGRVDQSSTLPAEDNTYFYPSATLSVVFSEFIDSDALDFAKFRLNYADVGNDAPALSTLDYYDINSPFGGVALGSAPVDRNNNALVPENTRSFEAGLEFNMFNNRFGGDVSLYQSSTFNQILRTRVSASSGSYFKYVNAGQIDNRGVEVSLYGAPVRTENFSWNANVNWSLNRNEVVELFEDTREIILASLQGGINITAAVGQPYGTIKGTNFVYTDYATDETDGAAQEPTDDAQIVVYDHPAGGVRYRRSGDPQYIGNIQPDWNMGIGNTLNYGPFSLYFLVDIQKGGQFFSLDTWYGYATGIYDLTAGTNDKGNPKRDAVSEGGGIKLDDPYGNGLAYETTNSNGETEYVDNEIYGNMTYYANSLGYATAPNALHVHDASFVKLREVSLGYTVPASVFENTFINSMNLSVYGRNLWLIHSNAPYTDPEAGLSAGNIQGYQSGAYPMVREMGLKVGLNF